ncbi:type IVB secretion system protein IcmH/DotU [Acetobacter sp. TBRC 12305]|uniref:Type IVB secretion system protein IcmH/DotU n=1 Tax=Acetobacter garciniae TaxID=2817435 RepID=A0A939HL91_9PROT|nr:type IVB secretion system protein IcmH/DotU [Acetobacter garciniae]MBO1326503.1 type IVB secretion system protein IcmH/DotU [Acetobacter garciniae]MBX0346181.1 type IVB secretion system protein IcmH/DotU [Acetobacter garciniae]
MSSDNPFAEPDDSDRTIIRPMPGGRKPGTPPPAAPAFGGGAPFSQPFEASASEATAFVPPADAPPGPRTVEAAQTIEMGGGPLLSAAGPLLQLLGRLRQLRTPPNQTELRERTVRALRAFEEKARLGDIPMEQLRPAHYALCASLDDVILATPWGSQGIWAQHSLVSTFHQEVRSGERFFDVLQQIRQNPGRFLPVLELMYFCLSLGYMGRYRLTPRGMSEIDRLREETYEIIRRQKPRGDAALSPHWQGVNAPFRGRGRGIPLWTVGVLAAGVLGLVFAQSLFSLSSRSDTTFSAALSAPPAAMPQILRDQPATPPAVAPAAGPTILQRLSTFLQPEIAAGQVSVLGTPRQPMVRINNLGLFASGSAAVETGALPLLHKIGTALASETGQVSVTGYTDNQPIHTLRFPSNFELSRARAQAAGAVLGETIGDASRVVTNGMGAADPVADNATPAGRGQNRRIEIVLDHPLGN